MNGVEAMASWFTPTVLFCVINLMIGTIFIASSLKPPPTKDDEQPPSAQPQLARGPSFFERVKSFNMSRYQHHQAEPDHRVAAEEEEAQEREEEEAQGDEQPPFAQPQLSRGPSFFERVKSFNMSRYQHHQAEPDHRVAAEEEEAHDDEQPLSAQPQLARVPSFFERVKSFNMSRYQHHQAVPDHRVAAEEEEAQDREEEHHHVTRSKSAAVVKPAPVEKVLQRSASEKISTEREEAEEERRRPATMRERTAEEDEAVDDRADDFIQMFRQQLKLQRLESLLRMRGSPAART